MAYIPPNANGQATMANSAPVVIASNQSNVPITLNALNYPSSSNNSSSSQLAASATFTGTIETIQNQQAAQIEVYSDQPFTLYIEQFIDLAGTKLTSQDVFTRLANVPYSENVTLPGNYFRIRVTNTGASTTTTLTIDTTFGIMATGPRTITGLGNNRTALNELNGTAISTNNGTTDAGTQRVTLSSDSTGQVKLAAGANAIGSVSVSSAPTTAVTGTFWQATQPVSLATNTPTIATGSNTIGSVKITDGTNTGAVKAASTAAAATDPSVVVNISPNSPAHPITISSGTVTAVTAITNALPAGTNLMGKVGIDQTTVGTTNAVSLAQLGANTIATGNGTSSTGTLRVALASDQTTNTNPLYMKQQAQTTGGATPYQLISAATTNATSVKASAATIYGVQVYNNTATVAFLKLYNKASAPTVGTDTPVKTIEIPANGGSNLPITDIGIAFGTGLAFAITGLPTVADTTAVTLSGIIVNLDYV